MLTLVSYREHDNNRKSHEDQNDKLNMNLLKETCSTHRVQIRSSMHFSEFAVCWESQGRTKSDIGMQDNSFCNINGRGLWVGETPKSTKEES